MLFVSAHSYTEELCGAPNVLFAGFRANKGRDQFDEAKGMRKKKYDRDIIQVVVIIK
jgi:hypothetical protein